MALTQVADLLAAARERSERPLLHAGALPISNDAVRCLMESAADVPCLLAAVEAAHRPVSGRCAWCREAGGQRMKWPCGEYQAISRALLGEFEAEEAGRAH